jgi:hypothetical protein
VALAARLSFTQAALFCARQHEAAWLAERLSAAGLPAAFLSGAGPGQRQRLRDARPQARSLLCRALSSQQLSGACEHALEVASCMPWYTCRVHQALLDMRFLTRAELTTLHLAPCTLQQALSAGPEHEGVVIWPEPPSTGSRVPTGARCTEP